MTQLLERREAVDPDTSLDELGIDSALGMVIAFELEQRLGRPLPMQRLEERMTLREVVRVALGATAS